MLPLKVLVASPDGEIFDGEATEVVLPSVNGDIAILKDHQPVLVALREGNVRVKNENNELKKTKVLSGVASVASNDVKVAVRLENQSE